MCPQISSSAVVVVPSGGSAGIPSWAVSAVQAAEGTRHADLVEVLSVLDTLQVDAPTRAAAVAHMLDCWPAAIEAQPAAERLREGLAEADRIWRLHADRPAAGNAEGLRRLLLAIVRDLRVVFVLLAEQLVQLRRATRLSNDHQRELARRAADILAPLANRLGIWQLKWELEDLAFRCLNPDTYRRIARLVDERRSDRERYIVVATQRLSRALRDHHIQADVTGRPKHIFSIWKKMSRKGHQFKDLYDVRAVRVLVQDVAACYAALGVVHSMWTPIPQEFDDYIARPKGNNYQSLHTAVVGPEGKTLEVQIRSHDMHAHAELGVAAHWKYKEGGGQGDAAFERKVAWMRSLLENRETGEDDSAIYEGFRTDTADDRIYVLTPRGEVVDLPAGATVLDFAYSVHTEVGHRCRGAKVNGRIVPLNFQPQSGDRIEIMTAKESAPRRDWLNVQAGFLHTGRARDKVRAWFRRLDHDINLREGAAVLERELKRMNLHDRPLEPLLSRWNLRKLDELHVAIALGEISPAQVARALHEAEAATRAAEAAPPLAAPAARARAPSGDAVTVEGIGNLLLTYARCCQPLPGDAIIGYVTLGRGVSVHRHDCRSFARSAAQHPDRVMPVSWGSRSTGQFEVDLMVRAYDRAGLLKDVTGVFAAMSVNVLSLTTVMHDEVGEAEMRCVARVRDVEQLGTLLVRLGNVPSVREARRVA
jgi:GTP pyrophosphokinase